ncbi:hypothetical protein H257_18645 [Aphanomyces astaci]|uniref:Uncharacterized protein n=1 Tax=Aphanomyces astaci TaxID=112090 RepID=W4FCB3_APHAT|nr:hypothetical protein H257_18645 [Aphanomyces astaci]ETV64471.1 hypothetical protein H257_18645 [Aphanomyces astaci]|eukprot:XP_009846042.1 hypothetical protein H257_18645 [Aphanomyces astaci]
MSSVIASMAATSSTLAAIPSSTAAFVSRVMTVLARDKFHAAFLPTSDAFRCRYGPISACASSPRYHNCHMVRQSVLGNVHRSLWTRFRKTGDGSFWRRLYIECNE